MKRWILPFCLLSLVAVGQQTPSQIAANARAFQALSDRDLEVASTYLLMNLAGLALTPSQVMSNASAFQALSDHDLKIAQTYLLSQITSVGASSNALTNNNSFAVTFSNSVTIDATHEMIAAHYSGQTGPTPTALTNVACGPSSVLTFYANSRDTAFGIKIQTGSAPTTGQIFHLTFGTAFNSAPTILWSPNSLASGQLGGRPYATNATTGGFDFYSAGPGMTASTNYEWEFIVIE